MTQSQDMSPERIEALEAEVKRLGRNQKKIAEKLDQTHNLVTEAVALLRNLGSNDNHNN